MPTAIVTGANGFIGKKLCAELLAHEYRVYGVERKQPDTDVFSGAVNYSRIVADFSDYSDLADRLPPNADVFFHLAWNSDNSDYSRQIKNIEASCDAMRAAIIAQCRKYVFVGSFHEFAVSSDSCHLRKNDIYSIAKSAANKMCKNIAYHTGIQYCSAQLAMCYGAGSMRRYLVPFLIEKIIKNQPCPLVSGEQLYDIVPVQDVAEGLIAVAERGRHLSDYYLGHSPIPLKEIIIRVRDILNPDYPLVFGEIKDGEILMDYSRIPVDLLKEDTGFECHYDFRQSILETADWIRMSCR